MVVADGPVRGPGRPAGRQGADLLAIAREVFLDHGFAGATMHQVAARARISKTSLYREHRSKDDLFAAVVTDWAARGRDAMRPHLDLVLGATDVRAALVELAVTLQQAVLSPDVVLMRRLVASESDRFPETAATYLADSWTSNIGSLAETIATLQASGRIALTDPWLAAQQFTWTAVGAPLNALTIAGDTAVMTTTELRSLAHAAAAAIAPSPGSDRPTG